MEFDLNTCTLEECIKAYYNDLDNLCKRLQDNVYEDNCDIIEEQDINAYVPC